ncbi:MAG: MFS transporter [Actinobacteria bacterium]|nr:MAG: MFS transporter [Actinomycetota bacterium]
MGVLRNRSLIGLVTAELVSLTGSSMTFVALPFFVLITTGSTAKMGWALAAEMLPIAIFGIPAGTVIAKLGAKKTMLISDAARGPLLLVIPILHHYGDLSFAALLGTTFAIGIFAAPYFASSRLIVPEVAGEDEQAVASVNAVLSGANQLTQLAGPVLAGVIIGLFGASTVLVVDGCSYIFSFLVILTVVRAGKRVEAAAQQKGVFSGLKFLLGDSLLGPMVIAACAINFVAQGIALGVQAIDYFRYNASGHVVGILFAGFGIGALAGAIVAQQLTQKVPLLKLAAVAIVAMPLPLFLLSPTTPWPAATIIIAGFAFFTPLVNAPVIGILTVRTPAELRPKVMTAVMTVATMAGPFGFIAAGYLLRHVSLGSFFIGLPALLMLASLAFAGVLLRNQRGDAGDLAVASG